MFPVGVMNSFLSLPINGACIFASYYFTVFMLLFFFPYRTHQMFLTNRDALKSYVSRAKRYPELAKNNELYRHVHRSSNYPKLYHHPAPLHPSTSLSPETHTHTSSCTRTHTHRDVNANSHTCTHRIRHTHTYNC